MPDVVKFVAYVKSNYARVVGHKCPTYDKQHFLFCRPQGFYKGFRQPENQTAALGCHILPNFNTFGTSTNG